MTIASLMTFGNAALGGTYTMDIEWDQTASLGSTNCCSFGSLSNFNGATTSTRTCQSYAGGCIQSRRNAFWTFDLSNIPEDATIVSATFKGETQYSDQGGSATLGLKAMSGSLNTTSAMSVINAPDWQTSQYVWGGSLSIGLSSSAVESARSTGKIAFRYYVATSNTVTIYNTGTNPARLSLQLDIPNVWGACCMTNGNCVFVPEYSCNNAGFDFLGEGVDCTSNTCVMCAGDYDESGAVDIDDLLSLLAVFGTTNDDHDLNSDGMITVDDLLVLIAAFGEC